MKSLFLTAIVFFFLSFTSLFAQSSEQITVGEVFECPITVSTALFSAEGREKTYEVKNFTHDGYIHGHKPLMNADNWNLEFGRGRSIVIRKDYDAIGQIGGIAYVTTKRGTERFHFVGEFYSVITLYRIEGEGHPGGWTHKDEKGEKVATILFKC